MSQDLTLMTKEQLRRYCISVDKAFVLGFIVQYVRQRNAAEQLPTHKQITAYMLGFHDFSPKLVEAAIAHLIGDKHLRRYKDGGYRSVTPAMWPGTAQI